MKYEPAINFWTFSSTFWASLIAQMVKNPPEMQETWFDLLVGQIPWRKAWQLSPAFLPGEYPWTEEPSGTLHGVTKSWT